VSWRRSATSGAVRTVGTGSRPRPALRLSAWEAEAAFSSSIAEMIMRRSARRSCRSVRWRAAARQCGRRVLRKARAVPNYSPRDAPELFLSCGTPQGNPRTKLQAVDRGCLTGPWRGKLRKCRAILWRRKSHQFTKTGWFWSWIAALGDLLARSRPLSAEDLPFAWPRLDIGEEERSVVVISA
jgi:hypothetical protein